MTNSSCSQPYPERFVCDLGDFPKPIPLGIAINFVPKTKTFVQVIDWEKHCLLCFYETLGWLLGFFPIFDAVRPNGSIIPSYNNHTITIIVESRNLANNSWCFAGGF